MLLCALAIAGTQRRAEHWQPHSHQRSFAQLAFDIDPAALQIHATFHDDEAEAGPWTVGDVMPAMESVEQPLSVRFRNSDPLIPDGAHNFCPVTADFKPNHASRVGILHRVRQQVRENVVQQALVGLYFGGNVFKRQLDRASPISCLQHFVRKPSGECSYIQSFGFEFRFAGIEASDKERLLHKPRHAACILGD